MLEGWYYLYALPFLFFSLKISLSFALDLHQSDECNVLIGGNPVVKKNTNTDAFANNLSDDDNQMIDIDE